MLPHEKLEVYRKALDFISDASSGVALWDKRHAVAEQFGRASDSLVLNLAAITNVSAEPKDLEISTV